MKRNNIILTIIIVVAIVYRLQGLFNPLLDFHSWRQTDTATVAYNFYNSDMNIFHPRLNVFPEIRELEFHIYPYCVAILYKIFGFHEWFGRMISIAFGIGTIIFIYLLANLYFNPVVSLLAASFFTITPMAIYYNRTFMPESALLFFSIGGMYFASKWVTNHDRKNYLLSVLFLSLAFLTKITSLYLLFPLLYLMYKNHIPLRHTVIYISLTLIPPLLWYSHSHYIYARFVGGPSIWQIGTDKWFNKEILLNLDFYRRIWLQHLGELHFAYSGYLFFIIGFIQMLRYKKHFFVIWVLSIFFYFIIVAVGNYVHEYYQLPILLPGSILVGYAIKHIWERLLKIKNKYIKYPSIVFVAILLLWLPIYGYTKSAERMQFDYNYKMAGETLATVSNRDDKIVVISDGEPEVLYYSKRKGWHINYGKNLISQIKRYLEYNPTYLIILPPEAKINRKISNIKINQLNNDELILAKHLQKELNLKILIKTSSFIIFTIPK